MLTEQQLNNAQEILRDAKKSPRLTAFEEGFVEGLSAKLSEYGTEWSITDKQYVVLHQIERKIYEAG